MSPDQQREEEQIAIDRAQHAFERRQRAFIAVHRQFFPFGNGVPSEESMDELDAAEAELLEANKQIDRISFEIKTRKRN